MSSWAVRPMMAKRSDCYASQARSYENFLYAHSPEGHNKPAFTAYIGQICATASLLAIGAFLPESIAL